MRPAELGELIRNPKMGKDLHKLITMVPRLELSASIQPLTRSLLKIDLVLTPDFRWDEDKHGFVEPFLIMARAPPIQYFRESSVLEFACVSRAVWDLAGVDLGGGLSASL
jgi:Sec63 Brl domain